MNIDVLQEKMYEYHNELIQYINDIQFSHSEIMEQLHSLRCQHQCTNDNLHSLEVRVELI